MDKATPEQVLKEIQNVIKNDSELNVTAAFVTKSYYAKPGDFKRSVETHFGGRIICWTPQNVTKRLLNLRKFINNPGFTLFIATNPKNENVQSLIDTFNAEVEITMTKLTRDGQKVVKGAPDSTKGKIFLNAEYRASYKGGKVPQFANLHITSLKPQLKKKIQSR